MTFEEIVRRLQEAAGPVPDEEVSFVLWKCINAVLYSRTKRFDIEHPTDRDITVAATTLWLADQDAANEESARDALYRCRDKLKELDQARQCGGEYPAPALDKPAMKVADITLLAYLSVFSKTEATELHEEITHLRYIPPRLRHTRINKKLFQSFSPIIIRTRKRKLPTVKQIRAEINAIAGRKLKIADSTIREIIKRAGLQLNRPGQPRKKN